MLAQLDKKKPCRVTFVTADLQKKRGGEIVELVDVTQTGDDLGQLSQRNGKRKPRKQLRKNPNHSENATRNLRSPEGGIRKVSIYLITHFNGIRVLP